MTQNEDCNGAANELETKIIQQIEYYFSDINLSRDKFLKEAITKDSGWVPLQTLLTFNRLKSLSDDKSVIINALKKSDSNLLEISEDEEKIRRSLNKPLPEFDEKYTQELNERTIHIKGFPEETKLDDVMKFCKEFGPVENVEMRRFFKSKKFKGCIFVAFVNREDAQKVIDATEVKYGDKVLLKENKISYFARKKEFAEKKNSRSQKKEVTKEKKEEKDEVDNEKEEDAERESEEKPSTSVRVKAAIMKLKGVDDTTKFTAIKDVLKKYGNVSYVEDVKQNESFVRFGDKEGAQSALEKIKSERSDDSEEIKIDINGKEVVVEVLTGEEEEKYWEENQKNRSENNRKKSQKKKDFNRGKKGRNMWQRGKRGYQGKSDRDDNKRIKTE